MEKNLEKDGEENKLLENNIQIEKEDLGVKMINSHPQRNSISFTSSDLGKKLEKLKIKDPLLKIFKNSNLIKNNENCKFQAKQKIFNENINNIKENQSKVYNKLLWMNILSKKMIEDSYNENMEIEKMDIQDRVEKFQKLDRDVFKTKGYMISLRKRLQKIETDLDGFFYSFLKKYKEREGQAKSKD